MMFTRRIPSTRNHTFNGVDLRVEYHFTGGEPKSHDGPGCADEVEIVTVYSSHGDHVTNLLTDEQTKILADEILEDIHAELKAEGLRVVS